MNEFDRKELTRLIKYLEKRDDDFDALYIMAIALRINTFFLDQATVAQSPMYMVIETNKDHEDCPYKAARAAVIRIAKKILADEEAKVDS